MSFRGSRWTAATWAVPLLVSTACVREDYVQPEAPRRLFAPADLRDLPAPSEIVSRWQLPPESPWTPYVKVTLLSSITEASQLERLPDVRLEPMTVRAARIGRRVGRGMSLEGTAVFVDLRGAASVAFAHGVRDRLGAGVAPIVTFHNWPSEHETVPAEESLAALYAFAPRTPLPAAGMPMFLLDAYRLAGLGETVPDDVNDNRYALGPGDFPSAAILRAHGVQRVLYVVEERSTQPAEEEDLHHLFLSYAEQGIELHIADLDDLDVAEPAPEVLEVEPRETALEDPALFVRARGGFGGVFVWGHGPAPAPALPSRGGHVPARVGSGMHGGG